MDEELSAWVDDELDRRSSEGLLNAVSRDDALRRTWDTYHLIGDVMRGTRASGLSRARFTERLAAEPTVVAPRLQPLSVNATAEPSSVVPRVRGQARWVASAVAGVAAVGFVSWMAWPTLSDAPRGSGSATALVAPAPPSSVIVLAPPPLVPPPKGVANYLLAHQRWSPSYTMQGAVPYARLVADEGAGPRR
jgi:sigma-E factor negative regulatory protein RseA